MNEARCNINIREDGCITIKEVNGEFVLQLGADTDIHEELDFVRRFAEYMGTTVKDACRILNSIRVKAKPDVALRVDTVKESR